MATKIDIFAKQDTNMVMDLSGQKIMIYGPNDTGKTKQSCRFPKPLLLMAENGGNAVNCPKFAIRDWNTFVTINNQLVNMYDKAHELYNTIIIDTAEELVNICEAQVCKMYGVNDIGLVQDPSDKNNRNPNGYLLARKMFRNQINMLTSYGYTVVFISHEEEVEKKEEIIDKDGKTKVITKTFTVPFGTEKEKGSTRFLRNLCDFVIYTRPNGIDQNGDAIPSSAICKQTQTIFARSRYNMPVMVDVFTAENMQKTMLDAIKSSAEESNSVLVPFEKKEDRFSLEDYFEIIPKVMQKVFAVAPETVQQIVEEELGYDDEGKVRKVSSAKENDIPKLANIYTKLTNLATEYEISF